MQDARLSWTLFWPGRSHSEGANGSRWAFHQNVTIGVKSSEKTISQQQEHHQWTKLFQCLPTKNCTLLEKVKQQMAPLCASEDRPSALSAKACLFGEGPQAIRFPFLPCVSHLKALHISPFQPSTTQTSVLSPLGDLFHAQTHRLQL